MMKSKGEIALYIEIARVNASLPCKSFVRLEARDARLKGEDKEEDGGHRSNWNKS